ncbi:universal stress protein [Myceligenerans indicum]|uniref:Universal stress protein n=1 Tax=Myceligenerans indicum TaxID=2593663 RepID=A0ABS1LH84_9MICO|nr:universal stress protein [Myceligenerans indicum]MBL0885414.1 universal stress protein [Myceligenerans indicum]
MIARILVAVDDSPAALAAARAAVTAAVQFGAALRIVHVRADRTGDPLRGAREPVDAAGTARRGAEADALLRHVLAIADRSGVRADPRLVTGQAVARGILSEVRGWPAELIVIGRSDRTGPGEPYIGQVSRHVLELADVPVLVVPAPLRTP